MLSLATVATVKMCIYGEFECEERKIKINSPRGIMKIYLINTLIFTIIYFDNTPFLIFFTKNLNEK